MLIDMKKKKEKEENKNSSKKDSNPAAAMLGALINASINQPNPRKKEMNE